MDHELEVISMQEMNAFGWAIMVAYTRAGTEEDERK